MGTLLRDRVVPALSILAGLGALGLTILVIYLNTAAQPGVLRWNSWAHSEWLINYADGFIRRGLAGSLILARVEGGFALPLVNQFLFAQIVVFIGVLAILVIAAQPARPYVWPLALLVPGGVWAWAMGNEFYYRKEVTSLVLLGVFAIYFRATARAGGARRWADGLVVALIGIVSVPLALLHEGFVFLGGAGFAVLIYALGARSGWRPRALATAYMVGLVLLFAVSSVFKGNAASAEAIWRSISLADRALISPDGAVGGGIAALGQGIGNSLLLDAMAITGGSLWIWVLLIGLSAALSCGIAICLSDEGMPLRLALTRALALFAVLFACSAPLYALGWDYGRWLVYVNYAFFILLASGVAAHLPVGDRLRLPVAGQVSRDLRMAALAVVVVVGMTLKIPECCIAGTGAPMYEGLKTALQGPAG